MSARDLLFELCTEELPPRMLLGLSHALTEAVVRGIDGAGVPHGGVHSFATPRRLAVYIEKLAQHQPDRHVERRGPPLAHFHPAALIGRASLHFDRFRFPERFEAGGRGMHPLGSEVRGKLVSELLAIELPGLHLVQKIEGRVLGRWAGDLGYVGLPLGLGQKR